MFAFKFFTVCDRYFEHLQRNFLIPASRVRDGSPKGRESPPRARAGTP